MAKRAITQLFSDLSGEEILEGKGETIEFSHRGTAYTIDLTRDEAADFDAVMTSYLDGGTRVVPHDARAVRAWARTQGIEIQPHGRIPHSVLEQYAPSCLRER